MKAEVIAGLVTACFIALVAAIGGAMYGLSSRSMDGAWCGAVLGAYGAMVAAPLIFVMACAAMDEIRGR